MRLLVQRDIHELNANPYIINVRNGLCNVLEDTLTERTADYYSTVQLNVTYDKKRLTVHCLRSFFWSRWEAIWNRFA